MFQLKLTAPAVGGCRIFLADPQPPREIAAADPAAPPADETALLLEFVRDRDIACPHCGYNLRNLTRPQCPECGDPLHLKVGTPRNRFALFLLTVTPGMFSGVAATILLGGMLFAIYAFHEKPPLGIWCLDGFGWLSLLVALRLYAWRESFLRQRLRRQWIWAAAVWAVHLGAFGMLLLLVH